MLFDCNSVIHDTKWSPNKTHGIKPKQTIWNSKWMITTNKHWRLFSYILKLFKWGHLHCFTDTFTIMLEYSKWQDHWPVCSLCIFFGTSMHSSRMRTARLLPVSPSMHCWGGLLLVGQWLVQGVGVLKGGLAPGGLLLGVVWSWGGLLLGGLVLSWGCVSQHALRQTPLWTESQTRVKT